MASEWQLDKEAEKAEADEKYGWLWDDTYDEADDDSWTAMADQGDSWSWDYPDPLNGRAL